MDTASSASPFPICPYGAQYAAYALVVIGAGSIIYGAFAAMAQTDFKRLVAYSSVSHMGYVILGIAVWKISEASGAAVGKDYWLMGMNGAMFQMLAHGISSAGMFFMVGVIYDRVHHRDLNQFGGLMGLMPLYSALAVGIFFAGLGLPGLCGFIGEIFVVLSSWNFSPLVGDHCGLGRDPDRGIHPVGDPAGVPGGRIQGAAPRGDRADQRSRGGDRLHAVGVCHSVRRLSEFHARRDAQFDGRSSSPNSMRGISTPCTQLGQPRRCSTASPRVKRRHCRHDDREILSTDEF